MSFGTSNYNDIWIIKFEVIEDIRIVYENYQVI